MDSFGKRLAEKIGFVVQGGTVNVEQFNINNGISRQEYRNRQAILTNMQNFWIKSVLERSLHEQVVVPIDIEQRPNAVKSSWNLEMTQDDHQQISLPEDTSVTHLFDTIGEQRTLLILGEPGAGKTIALLQLAKDFIERAQQDIHQQIPILLNLSSWGKSSQTLAEWVVTEVSNKYHVPPKITQQWISKQELLLLLDGLDEIRDISKREACLEAINAFHREQATGIVVCCRIKNYEQLPDQLSFNAAIYLRYLTLKQIETYLDSLNDVTGLKKALSYDSGLRELARTPLFLNIMVLAYQGLDAKEISRKTTITDRKKQLFNDYINRLFQGSRTVAYLRDWQSTEKQTYLRDKATFWLNWLARYMILNSQSIFLIERLQPSCLVSENLIHQYRGGLVLIFSLLFGIVSSFMFLPVFLPVVGITYQLIVYLICGTIIGLVVGGIISLDSEIETIDLLRWSWRKFFEKFLTGGTYSGLIVGTPIGILLLIDGLSDGVFGLAIRLFIGVIFVLFFGLIGGIPFGAFFGFSNDEIKVKIHPNQGIKNSLLNGIIFGLTPGFVFGLILALLTGLIHVRVGVIFGLIGGLSIALLLALQYGVKTCIQHLMLRVLLFKKGYNPWNYAKFLDWASDKFLLQKVGGGYIFIHRLLMEHFAQLNGSQETSLL